jgi:predicted methyltransferase
VDLRKAINAVSDVVVNRPPGIREFDQIYMKLADMLLQAQMISKWFADLRVVFVGDGDAVGLCLSYLHELKQLDLGPKSVLVLDFDERVVDSINTFAERYGLSEKVSARLYNVADPIPEELLGQFDAFYTNPPFGKTNSGVSINAFMRRGLEACKRHCVGCVVLADAAGDDDGWISEVLYHVQRFAFDSGCIITEMVPEQHTYHLDDDPALTSCSLIVKRLGRVESRTQSFPLSQDERENFYGEGNHLVVRYIRDMRERRGGVPVSSGYTLEYLDE